MSREYKKRKRAESEAETKLRITEATMNLHETVGPARTTVSGIAELAGVQRATVYRHFPDEDALIDACSNHWAGLHPAPDPTPWLEISDPDERLRATLEGFYDYYDETGETLALLIRDAPRVPAIAVRMQALTQMLDHLADLLMEGRGLRGAKRKRVRAAIGHALQLDTWRSLVRDQGLSSAEAAGLIAELART
jgi:AcrR family transcriptional regulator